MWKLFSFDSNIIGWGNTATPHGAHLRRLGRVIFLGHDCVNFDGSILFWRAGTLGRGPNRWDLLRLWGRCWLDFFLLSFCLHSRLARSPHTYRNSRNIISFKHTEAMSTICHQYRVHLDYLSGFTHLTQNIWMAQHKSGIIQLCLLGIGPSNQNRWDQWRFGNHCIFYVSYQSIRVPLSPHSHKWISTVP